MNNYFEVKVAYEKIDERGSVKKVTEPYLIDAMTFTEAEARAIKELEPYLNGEFIISNMGRANYTELFPFDDGDRWFKCKIAYVTVDEEKGTEKRKATYILVQANDVFHACDNLEIAMSDSVVDYEVNAIQETSIVDVFPYSAESIPTEILPDRNTIIETYIEEVFGECSCQRGEQICKRVDSTWTVGGKDRYFYVNGDKNSDIKKCVHCEALIAESFKQGMI